jgi:hypothetical protein
MPAQRFHHRDTYKHRIAAVRRPRMSIAWSGRDNPQLLSSERSVNDKFGLRHRRLLIGGLAQLDQLRLTQRHRPFPDAAFDALNECIFDASIFHVLYIIRVVLFVLSRQRLREQVRPRCDPNHVAIKSSSVIGFEDQFFQSGLLRSVLTHFLLEPNARA